MCFFISVYLLIRVSEKCQNILFLFSKEERFWTFIGVVYHLIFLFQSSRLLNPIQSFQKFTSITESFILYFFVSFLVSFWIFCPPFYVSCLLFCLLNWAVHLFCLHFCYNVHHLHNLAYHFHCLRVHFRVLFGVHSKFWGSYYRAAILFDKLWKMWNNHLVLVGIMWKYRMKINGIMWNIYVFIAQIMWKVLSLQL